MQFNAYNTLDPATLLKLKQQEAQAILDLVRSIKPDSKPSDLAFIVTNTIRAQLAVNKLIFAENDVEGKQQISVKYGFQEVAENFWSEIISIEEIFEIKQETKPLLFQMGVEFVVPLGRKKDPADGWFLIADFAESEAERNNDLMFIETVGNILMFSLDNIRLFEIQAEQRRMRDEMEIAEKIQKQSLPSNLDINSKLDIFAHTIAHLKVGGDFYDVHPLNDHELYICIADVCGKGIGAALLVASVQANLRALWGVNAGYDLIIKQLHQAVSYTTRNERFVTLFIGRIDTQAQTIEYINAGHNPPVLIHNGKTTELSEGCIPLGIMPLEDYEIGKKPFLPGDVIFLYTDGLTEQENPQGEFLDYDRLLGFLKTVTTADSIQIVKTALRYAESYAEAMPTTDDITVMSVKFNKL